MKFPSCPLAVRLLWFMLAVRAADDMPIHSGRFDNGWGDACFWMPHCAANNPVYAPSNSVALVPNGQGQTWWRR